jgi:tRNA (guanine-N7-)-methyltransferase
VPRETGAPPPDRATGATPAPVAEAGMADRLYGRRRSRTLSQTKRRLMDELLPQLAVPVETPTPADLSALFGGTTRDVHLENGFGSGEHLIAQAAAHPDIGFVGIEPFENGMAKALRAVTDRGLANVRLFQGDARHVLAWLPSHSIGRIDLFYPDPWPKRRQMKRRFVSAETLDMIARVLRPDDELRFASDIASYVEWTRAAVDDHPALEIATDSANPWPGWRSTRYEEKAIAAGRTPRYLTIVPKPRHPQS